jgi:demethylmenaquinone methyltransferase/2-methoxy-6-polyprenyl-1,4-benzoquinol methylase
MKDFFGFKKVEKSEKQDMVQQVFTEVAEHYDKMNDAMSLGLHRLWKDEVVEALSPCRGKILLDAAGGTGDIATRFMKKGGEQSIVLDLNASMLAAGKERAKDQSYAENMYWVEGNAEALPFEDEIFDCYTIVFGIRNVTNIDAALREAYRILRPGGKFVCMEFANIQTPLLSHIYDFYSFKIIPLIGKLVANNKEAYKYLVESIRKFPHHSVFANMMEEAGLTSIKKRKLAMGGVVLYSGYKIYS